MGAHLERVKKILTLLDGKSERLLDELSLAQPEDLHSAPVEGAWSPLQVMHHIALTERASVDYLLFKYSHHPDEKMVKQTLSSRMKGKLVVAALLSPLKFQAPKAVDVSGQNLLDAPTLSDIGSLLRNSRDEFRKLLDTAPADWLRSAAYRHPRAGRMSIADMTIMFLVHHDRHARQIKRSLAQNARNHRR